ncbi:hypothetical protein CDAR_365141 [Caerostris darwini]|uniref:Uncharacterized protein n=1 Tax=Caerostris darwini TaxID=1538125 RepID=A0AAV4U1H8_9ARAC|nr:hypothetical protein CDAR_365141 [Caerostris darwini]
MHLGNHRSQQKIEKLAGNGRGKGNLAGDLAADLPSTEGGGGQGKKKKSTGSPSPQLFAHIASCSSSPSIPGLDHEILLNATPQGSLCTLTSS